jgi:hypothetical protein
VSRQPVPTTISNIVRRYKDPISRLESGRFGKEIEMYTPVVTCLRPIFKECNALGNLGRVKVVNTHGRKFLGGLAPDISIYRGPVTAYTLCAFVEMKHALPFTNEKYGQCMDYLYQMERHQPGRKYYVGMMSTIKESTILVLTYNTNHQQSRPPPFRSSEGSVPQILLFSNLEFRVALSKLISFVKQAEYNPPELPFSLGVDKLNHFLGPPRGAALGIFPYQRRDETEEDVTSGKTSDSKRRDL